MIDIKKLLGLNVCCYKKFIKNRCSNLITLVNCAILYNISLIIYNYSYNIGYNCTNTILYMDQHSLVKSIHEAFHLALLLMSVCCWVAISEVLLDLLKCNKH
jgi:hypothetical protein